MRSSAVNPISPQLNSSPSPGRRSATKITCTRLTPLDSAAQPHKIWKCSERPSPAEETLTHAVAQGYERPPPAKRAT